MKINITKNIGKATLAFQVDGEKDVDVLFKASSYTTMPDRCGLCQSEDVILDGNRSQGFTFVKIKCLKCNGRAQMGQFKEGGIFWKEFTAYEKPTDRTGKEYEEN